MRRTTSYGIEVAKLAGLPKEVVSRAKKILEELEAGGSYIPPREEREQVSLDAIGEAEVLDALRRAQPDTMSPIEAMQLLYDLKKSSRTNPETDRKGLSTWQKKPLPPT